MYEKHLQFTHHDINFDTIPHDGQVLCQNGNSTLPLLVIAVHDTFSGLVGLGGITKDIRLTKKSIDKGGFTVIDVGNNGNVTLGEGEELNKMMYVSFRNHSSHALSQ